MCLDYCQALYDQWKQPGFYNQNFFHLALLHFICDIHICPIEIYNLCGNGRTLFLVHLVQDRCTFEKTAVKSLKRAIGECFNPLSFIQAEEGGYGAFLRSLMLIIKKQRNVRYANKNMEGISVTVTVMRTRSYATKTYGNHKKINIYLKK